MVTLAMEDGIPISTLSETARTIRQGIDEGLHLGAQLFVSLAGEPVADGALGEDRPGRPLTRDHLALWLSATKPVTALALARLWERGLLDLDDPVAAHIPEFAQGAKENVTLRHVLTHTGGFRMIEVGFPDAPWNEILTRICRRRLEPQWVPGEKAGYHLSASWFVLGELIRRLDGRPIGRFVREEIFEPAGMIDCWIGVPEERYRAYRAEGRIGRSWNTEGHNGDQRAPRSSAPPEHAWHREVWVTHSSPGGNGRGPMRELGRFYEILLAGGAPLVRPQTVEAMTARHRVGLFDHTFKHVLDWGLGFIPNSAIYGPDSVPYGYGPHASRRAFGHSGYRSVSAFADPEHRLAVALGFNGTPSNRKHELRTRTVLGALYRDLGLAQDESTRA